MPASPAAAVASRVRFNRGTTCAKTRTATANQISHRIAPAQMRKAAGTGSGSQGSTMKTRSQNGAIDRRARAAAATARPVSPATAMAAADTGTSAMRGPSGAATASVACESQAAIVESRTAAAGARRLM